MYFIETMPFAKNHFITYITNTLHAHLQLHDQRILVRLAEQGTLKFWKKKKTGKNGQNEHFETLKINQRSTETQGALLQEKQLNLSKNSKLCSILTHLHPISHFLSQ